MLLGCSVSVAKMTWHALDTLHLDGTVAFITPP